MAGYYDYDDPYKMLAATMVTRLPRDELIELANNKEKLIEYAVRDIADNIDVNSAFADAIFVITHGEDSNNYVIAKDVFARAIVKPLRTRTLQAELINFMTELGIRTEK